MATTGMAKTGMATTGMATTGTGKLEGKVAAITGGTRSIGRGIAEAFLREGASVVINGRDATKGQGALDEMGGGDRAAFFAGDAAKQDTVEGLIDFTIDHF